MTPSRGGRPWRAISKSLRRLPVVARTKLLLRRLAGTEPWLRVAVERPVVTMDGWGICAEALGPGDLAYSAGIGVTVAFELDLIRRFGVEVHAFDPTPATRQWLATASPDPALHYHPWALADRDTTLRLYARRGRDPARPDTMLSVLDDGTGTALDLPARRLSSIAAELGHREIALLKLDIEGAEYPVLADLLAGSLRPRQVLVEFHHRFRGIGARATIDAVAALGTAGYRIVAVAPTGREVSFLWCGPAGEGCR